MEHLKSFKLFESITKKIFDDRVEYYNNKGQRHREDGPAVEWNNGTKVWYLNGKCHRINGPAIEYNHGTKAWYINGKLHREDGPAIEYANGTKEWYLNGKLHREDGPARDYVNGIEHWFLNNNQISEHLFIQKLTNQKPNPNLFKNLPIDDLEELVADLSDRYIGEVKQWSNFYTIHFKEKLDKKDLDLKSFENRLKDFRIRINDKSILVY